MSLNEMNNKVRKLARQLARLSGESMAEAVTEAVRERLERTHITIAVAQNAVDTGLVFGLTFRGTESGLSA